jgi:hypothetical protein
MKAPGRNDFAHAAAGKLCVFEPSALLKRVDVIER